MVDMTWRMLAVGWAISAMVAEASTISIHRVTIVSRYGNEAIASATSKYVLKDEVIMLACLIEAKVNSETVYYSTVPLVRLISGKLVKTCSWPSEERPLAIRWYQVEPYLEHQRGPGRDPEFPDMRLYTNAHFPWCRLNRGWIGVDRIEYARQEIPAARGQWTWEANAKSTTDRNALPQGLGVMRFQVEVTCQGKIWSSPGLASRDQHGLTQDVFTLVRLQEDSLVGWLTGYFNVPGLHGSVAAQADRFLGVDCADLVVAGARRSFLTNAAYTNVAGLTQIMKLVWKGKDVLKDGAMTFGPGGADRGDAVLLDYPPYGSFDHVGTLYEDHNHNGKLDASDVFLHAGPLEPHLSPVGEDGILGDPQTRIEIRRWPFPVDLAHRWQILERSIRDGDRPRPELETAFHYLHRRLKAQIKDSSATETRVFPLRNHQQEQVGHFDPSSYIPKGYDFFDGNRHGGHPAVDIFIEDRNQDGQDDRTRQPVQVVAVAGGLVVSTHDQWKVGSPLRGGHYVWVYDRAADAYWYYAHLDRIAVHVGHRVKPGEALGTLGRTGANAYPARSPTHLHLSCFKYQDGVLVADDITKMLELLKHE